LYRGYETEGAIFVATVHEETPAAEVRGTENAVGGQSSARTGSNGSEETWTLRNLTPRRVELRGKSDALCVLPAYGFRRLTLDPYTEFFDLPREEGCGEVEVTKEPTPTPIDYSLLSLWVFIVPIAIGAGSALGAWAWLIGSIFFLIPLLFVFAQVAKSRRNVRGVLGSLPARALQALAFFVVLTFCLAVPAATLYYGANLKPVVSAIIDGEATSVDYLTLVCRMMQLVLISVASLLPALLYYQFDRDRLSTLREKFEQQIFRLDRTMKTSLDIDAKYGRQIDEIYGRPGRASRLQPGRRAPIFVATVLIMLGWLLVLLNPDVVLVDNEDEIAELFQPRQTAPAFAFLGAYFFSLFALLRGYVRRDLRPKSYSDISVRIVTVVILAWVLNVMFVDDTSGLLLFAFVVGIVPQVALNRLREISDGLTARVQRNFSAAPAGSNDQSGAKEDDAVAAAFADPLPLTNLQGIDLYDRTRLASEGVTNIEALAHHDLVELMLLTRIPVPRLVDWTDQAILHLHVDEGDRATLRRYGIRTASDLVHACASATNGDEFLKILGGEAGKPKRLEVIIEAMKDEAWMDNIRFWHGDIDTDKNGTGAGSASLQ
jgi:hypothetical protein